MNITVYNYKVPLGKVLRLKTAGTWVDRDLLISVDTELIKYEGPYTITPSAKGSQVFHTKDTWVSDDLIVKQVTYEEEPLNGGKAVYFR